MNEWTEFKNELKQIDDVVKQDVEEMEVLSNIINAIIRRRNELGYSQRDLANLCNIPQSTVARIEKLIVNPNLDTLFKILIPLGLTLTVSQI